MTLALTSWYIQNADNTQIVANDVNPKLAKLAFGDKYEGFFTYTTTDVPINNRLEIRFNPGLFVSDGFQDTTNLDITNESYYLRKIGITNSFTQFEWVGTANSYSTTRNDVYEIRKTSITTFEIKVTFYMLSDTNAYLGAQNISNGQKSRLTSDRFSQNPTLYNNTNSTIYTTNLALDVYTLGMYVGLVFQQQAVQPVNVGVVTPGTSDSALTMDIPVALGTFIIDGWDNPCGTLETEVEITIYLSGTAATAVTFRGVINPAATTATSLSFTSTTNLPFTQLGSGGDYAVELNAVECGDTYFYGTLADDSASIKDWSFLDIDGIFADDGIHTARDFKLIRSGLDVTTINTTNPTTIQFDLDYTGSNINRGKLWIIPTNIVNGSTLNWYDSLERTPAQFQLVDSVVNIVGNTWRITKSIDPIALNLANNTSFHFLFVLHDDTDNYYASYVYQNVPVSNRIEIPDDGDYCILGITGNLSTYKNVFNTDYLQVSPLQRVRAQTIYDKLGYNTCSDFNRVQRITATLELLNGTILDTMTVPINGGIAFTGGPGVFVNNGVNDLTIDWVFRIEHRYTLQEIRVKWVVKSLTEPTEVIYYQQFKVDDYQQNLPAVDQLLDDTIFLDSNGFILGDDDRNCTGDDITVRTYRIPTSPEYFQNAVWLDSSLTVEEEDGFTPFTPNINAQFSTEIVNGSVDENFNTNAPTDEVEFKITSGVNSGDVGMIGYPPPLPVNKLRVMFHHTNPNGLNIVFVVQKEKLPGSISLNILGSTAVAANYTVRVGDNSAALQDANNGGWGAFPTIPFTDLVNMTLPAGTRVRVQLDPSVTATDIVAYFDYFTDVAISLNRTLSKTFPSSNLAAGDIMLYTGTRTEFNSVSTNATISFTEQRTISELNASSNLTDYVAGSTFPTATWNTLPNFSVGNHLYLRPAVLGGFDNTTITTTTVDPNLELSTYASPLSNEFYPVTPNGVNPNTLKGDAINDLLFVPNGATGSDLLFPQYMLVGESRSYTTLGEAGGIGVFVGASGTDISDGYLTIVSLQFTGGTVQWFAAAQLPVDSIRYFTTTITRTALTGTAAEMYQVVFYINGRKILPTTIRFSSTTNIPITGVANGNYNLGLTGVATSNLFQIKRSFFAMHDVELTFEEIRRIHLGEDLQTVRPALYYYDLTNLVVDGANRTIPNLGAGIIDDARLENSNNELDIVPLFT